MYNSFYFTVIHLSLACHQTPWEESIFFFLCLLHISELLEISSGCHKGHHSYLSRVSDTTLSQEFISPSEATSQPPSKHVEGPTVQQKL